MEPSLFDGVGTETKTKSVCKTSSRVFITSKKPIIRLETTDPSPDSDPITESTVFVVQAPAFGIGEFSLVLDNAIRTANVESTTPLKYGILDLEGFTNIVKKNPEIGGINKVDKKLKKLKTVRSYGDPRDIVKTYKPAAAKKFGSKLVKGLSKLGPKGKAAAAVVGLGLGAYALTKAKFGKKKDGAGAGATKKTKLNPPIKLDLGGE